MNSIRRTIQPMSYRPERSEGGPSLAAFFFWTVFMVSAAIGYLWVYNQNDVVIAQIVEQQTVIQQLEDENRELQVAIDGLSQVDRITRIARQELSMVVPPAESLIVYLTDIPR